MESFHSVNAMSSILAKDHLAPFSQPTVVDLLVVFTKPSLCFRHATEVRSHSAHGKNSTSRQAQEEDRGSEEVVNAGMMPESFKWQLNAWQASNKPKSTRQHVRPRGCLANGLSRGSPAKPPSVYPTKQYPVQQQAAHILIPVWTRRKKYNGRRIRPYTKIRFFFGSVSGSKSPAFYAQTNPSFQF